MSYLHVRTWQDILVELQHAQPTSVVRVAKHLIAHPEDVGARRSVGLPFGQSADFRFRLTDCSGLHVRDFGGHYEAHIDTVDPQCDLPEHLRADAPGTFVAGAAAIGALAGLVLGDDRRAVAVGAGIGAVLGALSVAARNKS